MRTSFAALSLALLLGSAPALAAIHPSPPSFDAYAAAPALPAQPATSTSSTPAAFVASIDDKRDVPAFLWAARTSTPDPALHGLSREDAARLHLERHAARYRLGHAALAAAKIVHVLDTGRGGIVVTFRQEVKGVEVFHQDLKVVMDRSLHLVAIGGSLHAQAGATVKGASFKLTERDALSAAFKDLYGLALSPVTFPDRKETDGGYRFFDLAPTTSLGGDKLHLVAPLRVKKVFYPLPDRLVPAYFLEILAGVVSDTDSEAYAYVIAADDGRLLHRVNLTHQDAFQYRVYADAAGDKRPFDGPLADFTPHPTGVPDGSFPGPGSSNLVTIDAFNKTMDPWLPAGAAVTTGNNVDAYTDDDAPDGFSGGDIRATPTSPGVFDRTYDTTLGPQANNTQKMASVTDLFYVTNWLHDFYYDSGFDEAGGNAQADNFGRGGLAKDRMHAEAQDGAPQKRNNSNMSVPADGLSPRMQMFVWDGGGATSVSVQPLNQSFVAGVADFGPQNFNVMGPVVLVADGTNPATDACQAITNNVTGAIALLDRGNCSFKQKAQNAQAAGAAGYILVDNQQAGAPPPMGGNPGGVNIPGLSLTLNDGNALKAALRNGTQTATLARTSVDNDGTLDNTVVAHEWGHYLHLRNVACDTEACGAESEGWGDFIAAMLTLRQGDNLDGVYAMAQYATASFPDAGYFGIRRYPYSTDMSKSPLTFKHISSGQPLPNGVPNADNGIDNAEVHNAGEVWAAMLFEAYVALLKKTTGPSPSYSFDEARRRMADYVVSGLKTAPTNPTYTEQRDAILAAAAAKDPEDLVTLAAAFAKRGAGSCAVSPPRASQDLTGVVESFTTVPNMAILGLTLDDGIKSCDSDGVLDEGETGTLTVEIMNIGTAPLAGASLSVSTQTAGLTFPNGAKVNVDPLPPYTKGKVAFTVSLDASVMAKTKASLHITGDVPGGCAGGAVLDTAPFVEYDLVPASSKSDDVESQPSLWTPSGENAADIWQINEVAPGNHAWRGVDFDSPSDTALVSPPLMVDPAQSFVVSFKHRYQFETSMGVFWDGAVIEISDDGGNNWKDISQFGNAGYTGKIGDPMNQAQNVLKNRQGFVDHNAAYPGVDAASIDLGQSFAGKTVQVRFRIGTDDAAGEFGWEIDDLAFSGITNTPFTALAPNKMGCDPSMGTGGTGGMGTTTTTTTTGAGGAGTTTTTTTTGAGGASGTGGKDSTGGDGPIAFGGCGCVVEGDPADAPWALPLLGLAALGLRRRRRAS
ncbi:MAG: M36 family metallopeptidase [Byssovorax sp.]